MAACIDFNFTEHGHVINFVLSSSTHPYFNIVHYRVKSCVCSTSRKSRRIETHRCLLRLYRNLDGFSGFITMVTHWFTYLSEVAEALTLAFKGKTILSLEENFCRVPGAFAVYTTIPPLCEDDQPCKLSPELCAQLGPLQRFVDKLKAQDITYALLVHHQGESSEDSSEDEEDQVAPSS